jgi:hypothetical protein
VRPPQKLEQKTPRAAAVPASSCPPQLDKESVLIIQALAVKLEGLFPHPRRPKKEQPIPSVDDKLERTYPHPRRPQNEKPIPSVDDKLERTYPHRKRPQNEVRIPSVADKLERTYPHRKREKCERLMREERLVAGIKNTNVTQPLPCCGFTPRIVMLKTLATLLQTGFWVLTLMWSDATLCPLPLQALLIIATILMPPARLMRRPVRPLALLIRRCWPAILSKKLDACRKRFATSVSLNL